jgi:hypothetical protein
MAKVTAVRAHVVRMSKKHDVDPFVVLSLLALHALADVDFAKLAFWKDVSKSLSTQAAAA